MRKTLNAVLALALTLTVVACGDDDPSDPGGGDPFVGTFAATSMIFTPEGGNPVDVILFGASLTVVVDAQHDFTWTFAAPGSDPVVATGSLVVSSSTNTVTLDFDGTEEDNIVATYTFSDGDDTLTLQADDVSVDLNGDDVDEQASVQVTMERQ